MPRRRKRNALALIPWWFPGPRQIAAVLTISFIFGFYFVVQVHRVAYIDHNGVWWTKNMKVVNGEFVEFTDDFAIGIGATGVFLTPKGIATPDHAEVDEDGTMRMVIGAGLVGLMGVVFLPSKWRHA